MSFFIGLVEEKYKVMYRGILVDGENFNFGNLLEKNENLESYTYIVTIFTGSIPFSSATKSSKINLALYRVD